MSLSTHAALLLNLKSGSSEPASQPATPSSVASAASSPRNSIISNVSVTPPATPTSRSGRVKRPLFHDEIDSCSSTASTAPASGASSSASSRASTPSRQKKARASAPASASSSRNTSPARSSASARSSRSSAAAASHSRAASSRPAAAASSRDGDGDEEMKEQAAAAAASSSAAAAGGKKKKKKRRTKAARTALRKECLVGGSLGELLTMAFLLTVTDSAGRPLFRVMQCQESCNGDLWLTSAESGGSLLQPGLCIQVKSKMPDNEKEWYTKRDGTKGKGDGLFRYQGYLVIFCHLSHLCMDELAPELIKYQEELKIEDRHLDSCGFYFAGVSKPGTYVEGGKIPPRAKTARSLLEPGDQFQTRYESSSAEGFTANKAFQEEVEAPYRVTRATLEDKLKELYANAAGWFKFRTLPQLEHMLGSDKHWVEQRWTKVFCILLPYLGYAVIVCRAGAPCDVILCGRVRAELKTGMKDGRCHFESTKQDRMWPEDGSERQLDMLIQLEWNMKDEPKWLTMRVLTHADFSKKDIVGEGNRAYIPAAFVLDHPELTLTLPNPASDSATFVKQYAAFHKQFNARLQEAHAHNVQQLPEACCTHPLCAPPPPQISDLIVWRASRLARRLLAGMVASMMTFIQRKC